MINRPIQMITSDYGARVINGVPGAFHPGLDLRCYTDDFRTKLPVILPEDATFLRAVHQDDWGWTLTFKPMHSAKAEIRFTHLSQFETFVVGQVYPAHTQVGWNGVTEYMKSLGLGEHLHFAVWNVNDKGILMHEDPKPYFDALSIVYNFAHAK